VSSPLLLSIHSVVHPYSCPHVPRSIVTSLHLLISRLDISPFYILIVPSSSRPFPLPPTHLCSLTSVLPLSTRLPIFRCSYICLLSCPPLSAYFTTVPLPHDTSHFSGAANSFTSLKRCINVYLIRSYSATCNRASFNGLRRYH
jgi:hypothetical protein